MGSRCARGFAHFLEDLRAGDVQTVDTRPFRVGGNLGNTPGAVVFRNRLVEVIQYAPTPEQTRAIPIVLITPWINKFYLLDLTESKSLVRHLVDRGFDVFITSWKNPGPSCAERDVRRLCRRRHPARPGCGARHLRCAGRACRWLLSRRHRARDRDGVVQPWSPEAVPVAHWTLLTTLTDFSRPGAIEVFLDARSLAYLDRVMARQGFLDGKDMGRTFRLLRSNSLIWHFAVHRYLYGETPPAFDVLYWNADSTRMPRAMHRYYLREFYVNNRLVERDGLTIAGRPIDLRRIRQPLYLVGTEEDHIAPWKATFNLCGLVDAPVRYALSTSGHILGIINPPAKASKRAYIAGAAAPKTPLRGRRVRLASPAAGGMTGCPGSPSAAARGARHRGSAARVTRSSATRPARTFSKPDPLRRRA